MNDRYDEARLVKVLDIASWDERRYAFESGIDVFLPLFLDRLKDRCVSVDSRGRSMGRRGRCVPYFWKGNASREGFEDFGFGQGK